MFRAALIGLIRLYQAAISSWLPPVCRFTPSCSAYGLQAVERHGGMRGGWLTLRRLSRCHPWGGVGYDPVPPTGLVPTSARGEGRSGDGVRDERGGKTR